MRKTARVFKWIGDVGSILKRNAKTFNCGVGMILVDQGPDEGECADALLTDVGRNMYLNGEGHGYRRAAIRMPREQTICDLSSGGGSICGRLVRDNDQDQPARPRVVVSECGRCGRMLGQRTGIATLKL